MSHKRPRQIALAAFVAVAVLALAACGEFHPNSTFNHNSDLNTDIDGLWNTLLFWGTVVFVFVELLLVFTIFRFRKRAGQPAPKQTHGNAALEITWTIIPALILAMIAVPTVKTIFKTQAPAPAGSLDVEVIGHQWWWEFRYPSLGIVTANELYLPAGRTVSFKLTTRDVLHSFWTPQLGGKRDLITNHTNLLWYTPNADLTENVWNGFCTEYCGSSHANMRFHVYTVSTDKFDSWVHNQQAAAVMSPAPGAAPAAASTGAVPAATPGKAAPGKATPVAATPVAAAAPAAYVFPAEKLPSHAIPKTPIPADLTFDDALLAQGDAARGHELLTNMSNMGKAPCVTCHNIRGQQQLMKDNEARGPNLTHVGSRHTFGGGLFVADAKSLARWIKNAPHMKPGSLMPTFGVGEYNAMTKQKMTVGLDDRQIADIVAYLQALK